MNRKTIILSFLFGLSLLASAASAQEPANPRDLLNQYIADLQRNPNDYALREKIIRLAQEIKPAPAVPVEVDEFVGQATYIFKNAKTQSDYLEAEKTYQKILLIAPWVADYYNNLGIVQEKAGKLSEAIESLKLYLAAAPNAEDARAVREHIGALKYQAQKNAEELAAKNAEEVAAKIAYESKLQSVEGTWHEFGGRIRIYRGGIELLGEGSIYYACDLRQSGRDISFTTTTKDTAYRSANSHYFTLTLSADGNRLVGTHRWSSDGETTKSEWIRDSVP